MHIKTAIVANSRLVEFAGSEIVTMEIADTLAQLGVAVTIAAYEFSPVFIAEIKARGYTQLVLQGGEAAALPAFDVAWLHHAPAYYSLMIGYTLRARWIISSSLSFFEPFETPPFEVGRIDRFFVNSIETQRHFAQHYPDYVERCSVFPNAAPPEFWAAYNERRAPGLTRVAVVSNHIVAEVRELIGLLEEAGVTVDVYGLTDRAVRVTAELIGGYDAVITIGKTVQYCLAAGIPVFCYDHFAGPGWITAAVFETAREMNFSGRSHSAPRPSSLLLTEFRTGYEAAFQQRQDLREQARQYFDLSVNLRAVLAQLDAQKPVVWDIAPLTATQRHLALRHVDSVLKAREMMGNAELRAQTSERQRSVFEAQFSALLASAKAEVDGANARLAEVYGSKSWQWTKPLRILATTRRNSKVRFAWSKFLLRRSLYVARHQGMVKLSQKSIDYVRNVVRNKRFAASHLRAARIASDVKEDTSLPRVSFIIPIYDRTDMLREAVQSALNQTMHSFEVLLVTDGSPQPTLDVVNEFAAHPKVRIFHFPTSSGNAVRGRNKGILEARGKYIAFLDSDDLASPDRLAKSLPLLESGAADVVYGGWRARIDGSRIIEGLHDKQVIFAPDADLAMLKKTCVPCQSTVMVRRRTLLEVGLLKPCMAYREDHELWARIAYFGGVFKSLPEVLVELRLHAGNNELNFKHADEQYKALFAKQYDKRGPFSRKIVFIVPGVSISGGIAVVFKHASMLMQAGHDVTLVNTGLPGDGAWFDGNTAPIVSVTEQRAYLFDNIDLLIATGWQTAEWLGRFKAQRKLYFVQSDERRFYKDAALQRKIGATYAIECEYFTEARWIQDMLRTEFSHLSAYVPNGLDANIFYPDTPLVPQDPRRLRVLLEGPIVIPFKGMADAYAAIEVLDCEIWIVSSAGRPPAHWRYDRCFEAVQMKDMRRIYSSCDVFLKMSRVEGFFGPPMEAMACGCAVVVGKVTGWDEYIVHETNALVVEQGDVEGAAQAVQRLLDDTGLRRSLIAGGICTAAEWSWERSAQAMLQVVTQDGAN